MQSEPENKNNLDKEWVTLSALQNKRVLDPVGFSFEQYRNALVPVIRNILQYKEINIESHAYKNSENYLEIKDEQILGFPGGPMSLEEFIGRFMPNDCTFESIYDMGNPCEIEDNKCTNQAVADDIWAMLPMSQEESIDKTDEDIINELERDEGLIERIHKYLGLDLNKLDRNDNREKRERSKILYFFYMLERLHYPKTRVLMLLDKPSMENIDNSSLGWKTHNGEILGFVKESLGKELPLEEKDRIHSILLDISMEWDYILDNARLLLDFLHDYGFGYNSVELFQSQPHDFTCGDSNQGDSYLYPIERLYLTISQREYLGNLLDIDHVNGIQNGNNYDVPPELVEEMKSLLHEPVNFNNAEKHIEDNALRLSRYVYLGRKTGPKDVQRIRTFAHKFKKFLNFCYRANCVTDMTEISNELQIVSFLQALILDNQSEAFDYTYHNYQEESKHMMRVQAALKNDKRVPDALQIYWVRKVIDRWYANVGKYDVRLKLRQIEQTCDEIREKILNQSTLEGMIAAHDFYLKQVDPGFFEVPNQIRSVDRLLKYLKKMGFTYEDHECKIRYAFLNPVDCDYICNSILECIQDTVKDRDTECKITDDVEVEAIKDADYPLKLAFNYSEKICTLTQFGLVFG